MRYVLIIAVTVTASLICVAAVLHTQPRHPEQPPAPAQQPVSPAPVAAAPEPAVDIEALVRRTVRDELARIAQERRQRRLDAVPAKAETAAREKASEMALQAISGGGLSGMTLGEFEQHWYRELLPHFLKRFQAEAEAALEP